MYIVCNPDNFLRHSLEDNWSQEHILEKVKVRGMNLMDVPPELMTEALCMEAVAQTGMALKYVPEEMRSEEMCRVAVNRYGSAMEFVPPKYITTEFCNSISNKSYRWAMPFIPRKTHSVAKLLELLDGGFIGLNMVPSCYFNKEFLSRAVKGKEVTIKQVPDKYLDAEMVYAFYSSHEDSDQTDYIAKIPRHLLNKEIFTAAVSSHAGNIYFVHEDQLTEEMCFSAVRQYGDALAFIPLKFITYDLCLEAVKSCKNAIAYVPELFIDDKLAIMAMTAKNNAPFSFASKIHNGLLDHIPENKQSSEIRRLAVRADDRNIYNIPYEDRPAYYVDAITYGMRPPCDFPSYLPLEAVDHDISMALVKKSANFGRFIPTALKTKDICLNMVRQSGIGLEHVPLDILDEEIIFSAINNTLNALHFIPYRMLTEGMCRYAFEIHRTKDSGLNESIVRSLIPARFKNVFSS